MRNFKSWTSKEIRVRLGIAGPVWQERFFDRMIRSEKNFEDALNYIHLNPVKHGLCARIEEYEFSSWAAYQGGEVEVGVDLLEGGRKGP